MFLNERPLQNLAMVELLFCSVMNAFVMSTQRDDGDGEWQPGAWIKCEATQERGQVKLHEGKRLEVDLGPGIMLFASSELLKHLGWKPICARPGEAS